MAFVLELHTISSQSYIKNYVISIIREFGINAIAANKKGRLIFAFDSANTDLQACLESIAIRLPASCFLTKSDHYTAEGEPEALPTCKNSYPLSLGLCPSCQKEMFDPSSRRYYYPFTSCAHCGGNYGFFNSFPYERKNSSFRFLKPCDECESEINSIGIREMHHINSCHKCGTAVRLMNKKNERYANDAGSFRTMFEVAAKAINDNKRVLIKTTFGYRVFYKTNLANVNSVLLMINAKKITDYLSLIEQEFNALLSIERPILHVAQKDKELMSNMGNTMDVKYPDEGFTILLAKELQTLGVDYIAYEDTGKDTVADILMDYDLEVTHQEDMRLFINKDIQFIASGERVSFPSQLSPATETLSIAHGLIGTKEGEMMLFDKMEHFESTKASKVMVLEGDDEEKWHSNQLPMHQDTASFMSVIAEHQLFGTACVGVYFDEEASFLYYDAKQVIKIVPQKEFNTTDLLQSMGTLREGSDRLLNNLQEKMPAVYAKLESLQERGKVDLFEAAAIILGLEDETMRGVTKEALKFVGKGGIQIDTHVKDNRFDHVAFLSSIVSYQLGGVESVMLSYSIFESLGDYFSELIKEIQTKTKAKNIILCGTHFANQSLFSRMQRNLKLTPPLLNMNYPIGKENAVVGGVYL